MARETIAVPSMNPGGLESARSGHFGHCDVFTLVHIDNGAIQEVSILENPPHVQGGCFAPVNILHQGGAHSLIVGGIGMRPLMGFKQVGIQVYYGPDGETVGSVIGQLLEGKLQIIAPNQVCGGGGV